jgi:hypothetical protein
MSIRALGLATSGGNNATTAPLFFSLSEYLYIVEGQYFLTGELIAGS